VANRTDSGLFSDLAGSVPVAGSDASGDGRITATYRCYAGVNTALGPLYAIVAFIGLYDVRDRRFFHARQEMESVPVNPQPKRPRSGRGSESANTVI